MKPHRKRQCWLSGVWGYHTCPQLWHPGKQWEITLVIKVLYRNSRTTSAVWPGFILHNPLGTSWQSCCSKLQHKVVTPHCYVMNTVDHVIKKEWCVYSVAWNVISYNKFVDIIFCLMKLVWMLHGSELKRLLIDSSSKRKWPPLEN